MRCILSLVILGVLLLFGDPSWPAGALDRRAKEPDGTNRPCVDHGPRSSDKGSVDAGPLVEVAANRMKEFGYTPVTDPTQPHDVELKIKCEQKKTWEGTTTMGSDADLPDAPSASGKGPACQLGYLSNGKKMAWRKEVRTDFDDAQAAATLAKAGDPIVLCHGQVTKPASKSTIFLPSLPLNGDRKHGCSSVRRSEKRPWPAKSVSGAVRRPLLRESHSALAGWPQRAGSNIAKASALALGNIGQKDTIPSSSRR